MAKQKADITMWVIIGLLAFAVFTGGADRDTTPTPGVDISGVISPSATFAAQNLYAQTTSITGESVRVIRTTGGNADLGTFSTNANETLNTQVGQTYKLYWGLGAAGHYPTVETYVAPAESAVDRKVGGLCAMDTAPTLTYRNNLGTVGSATTMGANDEKTVTLLVNVGSRQCFGAPGVSGSNAICFRYNNTEYRAVELRGASSVATPRSVETAHTLAGNSIACYELKKLANNEEVELKVDIRAMNVNPEHNISVILKDVSIGLNTITLDQINGFQDNDNGLIGQAPIFHDGAIIIA